MDDPRVNNVTRTGRVGRSILVVIGAVILAYAISDHPLYGGEPGFSVLQGAMAAIGAAVMLAALLPLAFVHGLNVLLVTLLLMLLMTEMLGERLLGPRHRPIYQYDDRLLFRFIPDRSSAMTLDPANGGDTVVHRINSSGFRGPELPPKGKAVRIAVYGDSFIHAYYAHDAQTFPVQLAAGLATASGPPIEVINAGVSSYGPDQIALKMERELPGLRPDLVIVSIYAGNDYGDLLRNKLFRLDDQGRLVANAWTIDPKIRTALDVSQRESILKRAGRDLMQRLRPPGPAAQAQSPAQALQFMLDEARREYESAVVRPDGVVTNTHIDYYSADVSLTPEAPSARHKVRLMQATLRHIKEIAAAANVPLVFMFIPHRFDVADNVDWGPVDKARFPGYDPRNQTVPLEQGAQALGVPYLSLFDVFKAEGAVGMYLVGGDDHWNARGQAVAARAMAEKLRTLEAFRAAAAAPR